MKFVLLALTLSLLGNQAFAAGAARWKCDSETTTDTLTYEWALTGDTLLIYGWSLAGETLVIKSDLYMEMMDVSPPLGSRMFVLDDASESDLQPAPGAIPMEVQLTELKRNTKGHDMAIQLLGHTFYCKRQI